MAINAFLKLIPEEREAVDNFAFAQSLINRGGDVERRFALICMDSSIEIVLRAYLLKIGLTRDKVEAIPTIHVLLTECESRGLELDKQTKTC